MTWRSFMIWFIVIFAIIAFGVRPILQRLYPIHYAELIGEYSDSAGVDPFLVAAMIQVESGFRSEVVSPKGAVGLMQIMPGTAEWIGQQNGIQVEVAELTDPQLNIQLGALYLSYLLSQFLSEAASLAAYNGGQGNVRRWLEDGRWDGRFDSVSDIPFGETRAYVRRVVFAKQFFRYVYHNKWYR